MQTRQARGVSSLLRMRRSRGESVLVEQGRNLLSALGEVARAGGSPSATCCLSETFSLRHSEESLLLVLVG